MSRLNSRGYAIEPKGMTTSSAVHDSSMTDFSRCKLSWQLPSHSCSSCSGGRSSKLASLRHISLPMSRWFWALNILKSGIAGNPGGTGNSIVESSNASIAQAQIIVRDDIAVKLLGPSGHQQDAEYGEILGHRGFWEESPGSNEQISNKVEVLRIDRGRMFQRQQ